jgi:hypothetical protein
MLWGALAGPIAAGAAWLGYESTIPGDCKNIRTMLAVAHWFDPVFFQYNLVLCLAAVLIVSIVPLLYIGNPLTRKRARLAREIPEQEFRRVEVHIERRGSYRFYLGSSLIMTIIVLLGMTVILFLKPVRTEGECGVVVGLGANILTLGPFITLLGSNAEDFKTLYGHFTNSLVGFQFGFLGAYIYFLTAVARAYFTLDLTPDTYVDGAIRIAVASVTSLVLSFFVGGGPAATLPLVYFFFGFFPERAIAFLEDTVLQVVKGIRQKPYQATPLSELFGMSLAHELRLQREGFDSVENLSHADAASLAVRTGFTYGQLRQWIGQAWLKTHLRNDFGEFVQRTGIVSRDELVRYVECAAAPALLGEPADPKSELANKLAVVEALLRAEVAESRAAPGEKPSQNTPVLVKGSEEAAGAVAA